MSEKVFLIHGWSVTNTSTYRALHEKLADEGYDLQDIYLGRYVSLDNEIEIRDIARAMHLELDDKLDGDWSQPFHFITHSTGALVARYWIVNHYKDRYLERKSLKNVIHLAGPHFGSRLAHHGRSMLSHVRFLGDTGKELLTALELGSEFSWQMADAWLKDRNWKDKNIRFYNLIGDRVVKNIFLFRIFPAHYEDGSDMVVRVPAGNMNFKRIRIDAVKGTFDEIGRVEGIPFCALSEFTHSGKENGIMNSISQRANRQNHRVLDLILHCLVGHQQNNLATVREEFRKEMDKTREKRKPFAQLDFRFCDHEGGPVDDYVFKLGYIRNKRMLSSKTVADCHKNKITPSHFTVFIDLEELEPKLKYFIEIDVKSGTELVNFSLDPTRIPFDQNNITELIVAEQTTQIEVIFRRESHRNLFVFHRGDDNRLHVSWNRKGEI